MDTQQENPRRELTTEEASRISGLSRNHITHLLRQEQLEGKNFGKRLWVVYADSLERYLAIPHKPGPKGPRQKTHVEKEPSTKKEVVDGQQEAKHPPPSPARKPRMVPKESSGIATDQ